MNYRQPEWYRNQKLGRTPRPSPEKAKLIVLDRMIKADDERATDRQEEIELYRLARICGGACCRWLVQYPWNWEKSAHEVLDDLDPGTSSTKVRETIEEQRGILAGEAGSWRLRTSDVEMHRARRAFATAVLTTVYTAKFGQNN